MKKIIFTLLTLFTGIILFAQSTVSGVVIDSNTEEPIPGVNVKVIGKSLGTATDFDGKFSFKVSQDIPFTLEFTYVGYIRQTIEITKNDEYVTIVLDESHTSLDEVVVSASRTPESVRESPVTIERMDVRGIKKSASASFYNSLENLKGVDVNTNSLTFNSINTRGFATFSNTRFVQLIDGMDNASPALNFVLGNLVGISELDVQSVEIIPGASSALYGANAFNGILFMTSKNPFEHQGVSAYFKTGLTVQESAGDNNYYDLGIRIAHAFGDKFAAKASFSYMKGTDWYADDTSEYKFVGVGRPDEILPYRTGGYDHNGINIYGDEVATDINGVAKSLEALGLIPGGASALVPHDVVGRTGYLEQDLTDYNAESAKLDVSLNYRPFADDLEIIYNYRAGFGSTIYQGTNRYQLKDFTMTQNKLEVKNNNFFVRGYMTTEDAGDSYDMVFTGVNMNMVDAEEWFGTYVGAYLQAIMGGATSDQAHQGARVYSDATITLQPGTPEFEQRFKEVTSNPDLASGSKFVDNTKMYVAEGNYNFASLINDFMDLQVGGSFRKYSLNSDGTIFTDYDGPINYKEYGAYAQASKKFFEEERLKLTASIRYDKNEFFDGNFSPRLSIVYSAGDTKNHNFRASYQTGFRNPTTQDLFIGLNAGRAILVGASPDNLDRILPGTTLTGRKVYNDSYSVNSVIAFSQSGNLADLVPTVTGLVTPEKVQAFDLGYRGFLGKVSVDINGYYNSYDNFISNSVVITPIDGTTSDMSGVMDLVNGNTKTFQTYTNSKAAIASYGVNIGLNTRVFEKFDLGFIYQWADLDFDQESDPDFQAGFNTPKNQIKASIGSANLFENFGFNVSYRWRDEFLREATIANELLPATSVFDAQVNYTVPKIKSMFKIGASNIGGNEYRSAPGSGYVGSMYYISWVINQ
ncbi:MAG: TonB-dependent receptor [Bacteroidota bacterium]